MKDRAELLREQAQDKHLCKLNFYANGGKKNRCARGKLIYCCHYCIYKNTCDKSCLNMPHVCGQHFMEG